MNRLANVSLKRQPPSPDAATGGRTHASVESGSTLEDLRELVRALDRRVPRLDHRGEGRIARDAANLRDKALELIDLIERSES